MNPTMFAHEYHIDTFLEQRIAAVQNEIELVDVQIFRNNTEDDIAGEFYSRFAIRHISLTGGLYQDEAALPVIRKGRDMNSFGNFEYEYTEVTLYQDVNGPTGLLQYPITGVHPNPRGRVDTHHDRIEYTYQVPYNNDRDKYEERAQAEKFKIERVVDQLNELLPNINSAIDGYNQRLKDMIQVHVHRRSEHVQLSIQLPSVLELPIVSRSGRLQYQDIPVESKLIKWLQKSGGARTEHVVRISEASYEYILDSIRHTCITMEQCGQPFTELDEEPLRNIILASLNSAFKGAAVGERFLRGLPSDITIEAESREVFVAECKVWGGPKQLEEVFDQLHKRETWRDCKNAVILFNKNRKGLRALFSKIQKFLNEKGYQPAPGWKTDSQNEWRVCGLEGTKSESDLIHVFLFDLSS